MRQILKLVQTQNEILVTSRLELKFLSEKKDGKRYDSTRWNEFIDKSGLSLVSELLVLESGLKRHKYYLPEDDAENWEKRWSFTEQTLLGAVVKAFATEWKVAIPQIISVSHMRIFNGTEEHIVAYSNDGEELLCYVDVIRNPHNYPVIYSEILE